MLFDLPPAELPVAKLEPRNARERIAAGLHAWVVAKWRWFKPRTIPMVVALGGLFAVIGSANYLRSVAHDGWERVEHRGPDTSVASSAAATVETSVAGLEAAIEQTARAGCHGDREVRANRAELEVLRKRQAELREKLAALRASQR